MQKTVKLNLDIIFDVTPEREADLIARANDRDELGVDELTEPITTLEAAVAELVMFDPLHLFNSYPTIIGWVATPEVAV